MGRPAKTNREEIQKLKDKGYTLKQIAEKLVISISTIVFHTSDKRRDYINERNKLRGVKNDTKNNI